MSSEGVPDRYTLLARKAVIEVNKDKSPYFTKIITDGNFDHHIEMRVALKAIEIALEKLVTPEHIQTMLATGKDGDTVAKTTDGGLTWTSVPYEEYKAEWWLGKPNTSTDAGTP